jgi:hypothetical protein
MLDRRAQSRYPGEPLPDADMCDDARELILKKQRELEQRDGETSDRLNELMELPEETLGKQ